MDNETTIKSVKPKTKRRSHLPKKPFHNIAISLSGGGFRATSIHLGLMSYLSTIKIDEVNLLERIRVLSSVSGGSFLGVKYAATIKKGGTFEDCYKSIVDFMTKEDLIEEALQYLAEDTHWNNTRHRSLINAFAAIYHRDFESETFGLLWNKTPEIHLKEISYNATEFHFGLPFHFQKTAVSYQGHGGHTGNKKIHIPDEIAKEIRLADIIAASSCVPFGFEPINFPDDFIYPESSALKDKSLFPKSVYDGEKIDYPIGLMDGGVDDNQGVSSILAAEERMKNYHDDLEQFRSHDKKAVDLYIISDGTNPTMEKYSKSSRERIPYIGKWSFKLIRYFGIASFLIGCALIELAFLASNKYFVIGITILGTFGMMLALVFLILSLGFVGLTRRLGVPSFFIRRARHVDKLKFSTINNLLANRRNSVVKMVTKVFIKQMRWFSFERVYSDTAWRPRMIMNAVFELTKEEVEKRKTKYPHFSEDILDPGEKIMAISAKSLKKGTTLWFTDNELKGDNSLADSIIACGQFTICFNLLEYFEKFIKNPKYKSDYEKYSDETKLELDKLQNHLLLDWKKFKEDPYWMVKEWEEKIWKE